MQKWCNDMSTSSVCSGYKMFKKQFEFEKYLLNSCYGERIAMCKLRCANIKLPVYNIIFMFDTDYVVCVIYVYPVMNITTY